MVVTDIKNYFSSNCFKPFMAYIDDDNYLSVKNQIESQCGVSIIRLSDCCNGNDKKPDLDLLREKLRELDVDVSSNNCILLGLGEYLLLEGTLKAKKILNELICFNLGTARVACLIRGFKNELTELLKNDIRLERQISVKNNGSTDISMTISSIAMDKDSYNGIKSILRKFEDDGETNISAASTLNFSNSLINISYLHNHCEAIAQKYNLKFDDILYTDEYMKQLWSELENHKSIKNIFNKYFFEIDLDEEFYNKISVDNYQNWLYFIYLKQNNNIKNSYLKMVIAKSKNITELKANILISISNISYKDLNFEKLYTERKKLIKYYSEEELGLFISDNRKYTEESIYKLTDTTQVEKQDIIAYICKHGVPDKLDMIYKDLYLYLKEYHFLNSSIKQQLTEYFIDYKKEKLNNCLSKNFNNKVEQYALSKDYNILPSRNELIIKEETKGAFLCWVDALGVEYLSYISEIAKKKGLMCSIKIGRSDLPTITSINRGFYDSWNSHTRRKVSKIDELKHHESGGYRYGPSNLYPIHLAEELEEIKSIIEDAAIELSLHNYEKYVITSDHGASRLAVLARKEENYETDTKGEHSGRCCKIFEGYNLPFASEENGYIVLADYGRFKGSRASNVEVHGGATFEEVVVPVISLTLKDQLAEFELVKGRVTVDRKTGIKVTLFSKIKIQEDVFVEYSGEKYLGNKKDDNHWEFNVSNIKKAGEFSINVYIENSLMKTFTLQTVGKMALMNDDFDDLF